MLQVNEYQFGKGHSVCRFIGMALTRDECSKILTERRDKLRQSGWQTVGCTGSHEGIILMAPPDQATPLSLLIIESR
jgi:hypothetical protein